ncbi:hypothetical protein DLJ53_17360 [Acuticoccus sediminis]|uniref:Uncharacterized protein n=1 Tax=Acuticoccus sediminis TaxID=2184697 RepID=A0A8B2NU40_9HYPH|nr:hypothetical protein [Acuticoccus sediminis]RAI00994.1 hypothetical protein DLJ53_17360 [Acuticoccus sediminis]
MVINLQKFTSEPNDPVTSFFSELERLSALEPFSELTFLYIRVRQHWLFGSDRTHLKIVDPEAARAVAGPRPMLVVDLSWEGIAYTDTLGTNLKDLMDALRLRPDQVVFVQTSEALGEQIARSSAPAAVKAIRHAWFHHYVFELAERAERDRLHEIGHARIDAASTADRMALCLNATPRPHRLALLYTIANHPQRHRFHATFIAHEKRVAAVETAAYHAGFYLGRSAAGREAVKTFFRDCRFDESAADISSPGALVTELEPDLYAATRMSLVTETEMTGGQRRRFTEKSIKPLLLGHPIMVFGNPGALEQIEALGFDVLRDVIPADYDGISDRRERFGRLVRIVDELLEREFDPHSAPELRERLHRNVAQFEGPLTAALLQKTAATMMDATAPARSAVLVS